MNITNIKYPTWRPGFFLITLGLAWFALSPQARAVCRDGCNTTSYSTFQGDDALLNEFGLYNTALGAFALTNNTSGSSNTATGERALFSNTTGEGNTATGNDALDDNTTGSFN